MLQLVHSIICCATEFETDKIIKWSSIDCRSDFAVKN
jgi:hypothetical protein